MALSVKEMANILLDNFGIYNQENEEYVCKIYGLEIIRKNNNDLLISFEEKKYFDSNCINYEHGKWEELLKEICDNIPRILEKQDKEKEINNKIHEDLDNFKILYKLINIYNDNTFIKTIEDKNKLNKQLLFFIDDSTYLYEKYNKNSFEFGIFYTDRIRFLVRCNSKLWVSLSGFDNDNVEVVYYEPGNWENLLVSKLEEINECKSKMEQERLNEIDYKALRYIREIKKDI